MNEPNGSSLVFEAHGLELGYGWNVVLRDVNLRIGARETWFLLGPNGSGKTTLLRAIIGELRPGAGTLRLYGKFAQRASLGFVPQRCDLNPAFPTTVGEFVSLGLCGIRVSRSERAARVDEALRRVGLESMKQRDYWSLSGGQRQRCLLARALIRRPRWLILDEPTSGVDLASVESLMMLLARINRESGLTILCVTHDLSLAVRFASHVALFDHGRVHAGNAPAVLSGDALGSAYDVPVRIERGAVSVGGAQI